MIDETIEEIIQRSVSQTEERMQRYIDILKEDVDSKVEVILEIMRPLQDLPERMSALEADVEDLKLMAQATFERVGELSVDVEILKRGIPT